MFADLFQRQLGGGQGTQGSMAGGLSNTFAAMPRSEGQQVANDAMGALGKPQNAPSNLRDGIMQTAKGLGIDPVDLATAISYETAGTFDPTKKGPTTQWGQHRGLIQFGEPQAKQYGVDWNDPIGSQLGENGAVAKYLRDTGVKPGMGMMDIYSAINAGGVGRYGASDANNGGAAGTVADKVNSQMQGHRAKAAAMFAGDNSYQQGGAVDPALIEAMGNPYMTDQQRSALGMILQQRIAASAPQDPIQQIEYEKAQLELDNLRNPKAAPLPASIIEQEWRAKQLGLIPGTPEYQDFIRTGGGTSGANEYGLAPVYGRDKDGNIVVMQLGKNGKATASALPEGVTPDLAVKTYEGNAGTLRAGADYGEADAAAAARGAVVGKSAGENIAAASSDVQAAQNALDLIQSLRDDPDRGAGTGKSAWFNRVPGTAGFNYQQKVDQAKGGAFLSAIQQMRGLGALSNNEGSAATAAVTRMNTAMTEDAFLAALSDYETIVRQGMEKAQALLRPDAQQAPPQGSAPTHRFNPATGKIEMIGGN